MASIRTNRLILRAPELGDAPRLAALGRDYDVARMVSSMPFPQPAICVEGFILIAQANSARGKDYVFAIELPGAGPIGVCGVHVRGKDYQGRYAEIGYWLGRPFWGRGYATEAARAVADFAVGLGRGPVVARHFADNPASGRVLEKIGFVYTGESKRQFSLARGESAESRLMERRAAAFDQAA